MPMPRAPSRGVFFSLQFVALAALEARADHGGRQTMGALIKNYSYLQAPLGGGVRLGLGEPLGLELALGMAAL